MKKWTWLALFGLVVFVIAPIAIAQEPTAPAMEEEEEEVLDIVSGNVTAVDLTGNKLTVTDNEGAVQEFALDPNLTTVWDDTADEEKELSDLAAGKDVVVEYRVDETGKKIASWIDLVAAEETAPAAPEAPVVPEAPEAPAEPVVE